MNGWKTGGWKATWWKGSGAVSALAAPSASLSGAVFISSDLEGILSAGNSSLAGTAYISDFLVGLLAAQSGGIFGEFPYYNDIGISESDIYSDKAPGASITYTDKSASAANPTYVDKTA